MQTIICPHCKKEFEIDESSYNSIVSQIRDGEFNKELHSRLESLENEKKSAIKSAIIEEASRKDKIISEKENELVKLRAESNAEIEKLKAELKGKETEKNLAVNEAVSKLHEEVFLLQNAIENNKSRSELEQKNLIEKYEAKLKDKDEDIAYYKEMKLKQSTKGVGESLEVFCDNEFNKVRAIGFKNAYFAKDNDASSGSKGDFIFRDYSDDGVEYISIMFEMKNQTESSSVKHKNEEFLKELDKDRREKGCEYAVLVSLLEPDNQLYNDGIVDVSHKFPKMYVIRPQFFIPLITILRNAALGTVEYKKELMVVREQNLDVAKFEEQLNDFKNAFGKNYNTASEKFKTAIEEIDKTISHLNKIKEALTSSENQLRLANNKIEDMSMKKLLKNSPSLQEKYNKNKK